MWFHWLAAQCVQHGRHGRSGYHGRRGGRAERGHRSRSSREAPAASRGGGGRGVQRTSWCSGTYFDRARCSRGALCSDNAILTNLVYFGKDFLTDNATLPNIPSRAPVEGRGPKRRASPAMGPDVNPLDWPCCPRSRAPFERFASIDAVSAIRPSSVHGRWGAASARAESLVEAPASSAGHVKLLGRPPRPLPRRRSEPGANPPDPQESAQDRRARAARHGCAGDSGPAADRDRGRFELSA